LRIVFAGTPDFAAKHLQVLIEKQFNIVGVYTQPDRPAGRGKKPQASAVKQVAEAHKLAVFQPENFKNTEAIDILRSLKPDLMIVVAYGIILPSAVLSTPYHGCINVHGSLLPKWRGAAPIQRAIWAGDKQTGVTIMKMDEGLDTGPMLYKSQLDINSKDTSASLYEKLAILGPQALSHALQNFASLSAEIQNTNNATYAKKLSKEEALIDWHDDADQLERNCRAFNPWPVQWFKVNNTAIKVWESHVAERSSALSLPGTLIRADKSGIEVSTGKDNIVLTKLQLPGKKPLHVGDILNSRGEWFKVGSQL
jgi:methionyl-tRNA formyltransferase